MQGEELKRIQYIARRCQVIALKLARDAEGDMDKIRRADQMVGVTSVVDVLLN